MRKRAASIQVRTPRMTINRREFIEAAGLVAGSVAADGVLDAIPAEAGDLAVARVQVTAVVNGQPRELGLIDCIKRFIDHRVDVVRRGHGVHHQPAAPAQGRVDRPDGCA